MTGTIRKKPSRPCNGYKRPNYAKKTKRRLTGVPKDGDTWPTHTSYGRRMYDYTHSSSGKQTLPRPSEFRRRFSAKKRKERRMVRAMAGNI